TAEKYVNWMKESAKEGDIVNLFMDYETFGEHQKASSGIFDFMHALPSQVITDGTFEFVTPSEAAKKHKAVAPLDVPDAISWADEERDVTAWLGNELQQEAFNKVYAMTEKLSIVNDPVLWSDFGHLQESDHFYYMCTKFFSDGEVHKYFNPYDTPYEAFINYMNVISDFQIRLDEQRAALDVKEEAIKETVAAPVAAKKAPAAVKKKAVKKK
ncbi:MAG: alpha-amylase, partial [Bacteroidales bacterium]|nr:alpha-amylase [Bacteroidales bacterium]